jgi:hypothetical protein
MSFRAAHHQDSLHRGSMELHHLRVDMVVLLHHSRSRLALPRFKVTSSSYRLVSRKKVFKTSTLLTLLSSTKSHSKPPERSTKSSSAGAWPRRLPMISLS